MDNGFSKRTKKLTDTGFWFLVFLQDQDKIGFLDIVRLIIYQSTSDTKVYAVTLIRNCNYALFFCYGIYLGEY